ncbi:bifunctional 2-polyprenyl-6-hydroxyphenol methylase/3-demethylubiquinol 3-O-methyltransferase UbiG [Marinobacter sp.]|uniref:class I SAM-dependent methyltransferase n=1 Tax=Marinobacter sp. TaxID=50741 RepID=UPI001B6D9259|nr:class I SAM-dependent methyltransferase [Marinobacter sp.]MBQ0834346.1 methyltransferase domain-containing protein [Marinobacter sp.]
MKQNRYDDPDFFAEYAKMPRSINGLEAAGEWHALRAELPDLEGKRVLDLGCGYGWHCRYASEQGASSVVGIDISAKMIAKARELTHTGNIRYEQTAIEDFEAASGSFDVVLSSLTLHYVCDLAPVFAKVAMLLSTDGEFCYSVEHPVFTARPQQDWWYDDEGNISHWPVDDYFQEGKRATRFLGAEVIKYHRTAASHFQALRAAGLQVENLVEPAPQEAMIKKLAWQDELRRPMMLILRAVKSEPNKAANRQRT